MFITPVIEGNVYQTSHSELSDTMNFLAELRSVAEDNALINAAANSKGWRTTYEQGQRVNQLATALTALLPSLAGITEVIPPLNSALVSISDVSTKWQAADWSGSPPANWDTLRQDLVDALYDFRRDAPTLIYDVLDTARGYLASNDSAFLQLSRPALQDYLTVAFAQTGQGMLDQELNGLGDAVEVNNQVLEHVNVLNNFLSYPYNMNTDIRVRGTTENNNYINSHRAAVVSARAALQALSSSGQLSAEIKDLVDRVTTHTRLSNFAASGGLTDAREWVNDLDAHSTMQDLISRVEFVNETLKQQLNEVFFTFTKFFQSAAATLSTFDLTLRTFTKRIQNR